MIKKLLFSLLFLPCVAFAAQYKTIYNPFTSRFDYVNSIDVSAGTGCVNWDGSNFSLVTCSTSSSATVQNYGMIYTSGTAPSQTAISTTPVKLNGFTLNGPSSNTTVSSSNDTITVLNAGTYRLTCSLLILQSSVTPGNYFTFEFRVNNSTTGIQKNTLGLGGNSFDEDAIVADGLVTLNANDVVSLYINASTTTAQTISVENGSMIVGTNGGGGTSGGSGSGAATLPLPPGDTNYIQNTNSLQNGSTFYVSSGTVAGALTVSTGGSGASAEVDGPWIVDRPDLGVGVVSRSKLRFNPNSSDSVLEMTGFNAINPFIGTDFFDYNGNKLARQGYQSGTYSIQASSVAGLSLFTRMSIAASTGKFSFNNATGTIIIEFDPTANSSFTIPIYVSSINVTTQLKINSSAGTAGQILVSSGSTAPPFWANNTRTLVYVSSASAGAKGFLKIDYNCTISSVAILGDISGSAVVDIKRCAFSSFPTTTSLIGAGNSPTLSSQQFSALTPASWTSTSLNTNDIIEFNTTSASTLSQFWIFITVNQTP